MLAHRNGFEVFVRFDKLHFQFPRPQFEATVLDWGTNLISFSPRLSTATMPGTLEVRGYNEELAQSIVAILPAIAADLDSFEMLGETAASLLVSLGRRKIENPKASNPVSAATLAMATLKALLEGLAEASGSCPGNPKMRAGEKIRVNGVGKRFSGTYRLRRVTHTINDQGYQTHFEASQRASMTLLDSLRHKLSSVPVLDPPTAPEGVAIGIVETNFDPTGHDRILVGFPAISKELFCWARLARPDAGDGTGTFFVPDRGDEVVVAFVHGGIDNAIILGSFWNQTRRAPESLSSPLTNFKRVIQTSSGHRIEMDDTPGRERLLVKHANVGQVVLEATPTGSSVSLEDTTGNSLKMTGTQEPSGSEIAIKSVGSVTITAAKGITIVGDDINLESKTGGVKISSQGQKIALRADDIDLTVKNTVNANKG
jgi:phage baseplate assembly protein gpV